MIIILTVISIALLLYSAHYGFQRYRQDKGNRKMASRLYMAGLSKNDSIVMDVARALNAIAE